MNATATTPKTAVKPCTCSLVVAFDNETEEVYTTGCTATTKRQFAPGHDARLKGFLTRAGRENRMVRVGDDVNTSAQAVADQFGFGYMVREGIARKTAKKVAKPQAKKVTAKVGRWEYVGEIQGAEFVYTDRKGVERRTAKFTRI
ncbi:hypothetical protein SEA_GALACTICA_102 [Streptomyces phage Galactica]|nr:hypothetical protein SEA_GALACTICA_102 [Streptomyces phage Galactica]